MKRLMSRTVFAVFLWTCAVTAHAERLFISDKLVVSVYTAADQESEKITTLDSGDSVDALERVEGYVKVKLADEREGWIRSSYLVGQPPAIVRLKELEKERSAATSNTATNEELKQLKEQNVALNAQIQSLKQSAIQNSSQAAAQTSIAQANIQSNPTPVTSSVTSFRQEISYRHVATWGGGIALVAGVIGFAWGYRTIAKRIERRYGKLKIY